MTRGAMVHPQAAVHRTIVVVDIEGFGDRRRTNRHQVAVRAGLYRCLRRAFDATGIPWEHCEPEDRGDGVFLLAPPHMPKAPFVEDLPAALAGEIADHNLTHAAEERIRLRMCLHAGEINYDPHGATATSINLAFRLLDAPALKAGLADSRGVLALIVSSWFYDEVVRHTRAEVADGFQPVEVVVKETTTTAWMRLQEEPGTNGVGTQTRGRPTPPDHLDTTPRPPPGTNLLPDPSMLEVPRLLSPPSHLFTGRTRELAELTRTVKAGKGRTILVVSGMGGIGKTWLALRWAHQNADLFPDGQLQVNLRGFDLSEAPMSPAMAVRNLLDALGHPSGSIPVDLDAQTALYRSLVARRRMLIVLDNARDTAQVERLLPEDSTCTVLVTSRNRLTGLVTAYGALPVVLDVLNSEDAREMLALRLGPARVASDPGAVDELIGYCAGLPLALAITAAHAASHRDFPLADLASELGQESTRLDNLDGGELSANLGAALSLSYHALDPSAADLFRVLGVVPGLEIGLPAIAALAGTSIAHVGKPLRKVESANLIQQYRPGRYRMHDLVRLYAAGRAVDNDAALRRLVGFYLHASHAGERVLYPHRRPIEITEPTPAAPLPALEDVGAAMNWFNVEHSCLLAAQAAAARQGWHTLVWQLAWTMHGYLWRRGHLHDQLTTWHAGLAAAERLSDPEVQALAHRLLGQAAARAGRLDEATSHLHQAIKLAKDTGDVACEARAHHDLTWVWRNNDEQQALNHAAHAVHLFRQLDNPVWKAEALNALGWHQAQLGHYEEAQTNCERALRLFTANDNQQGQAATLTSLGFIAHHCGEYAQALSFFQDSLALCRDLGATYDEADTLDHLGKAYAALGQSTEARTTWLQALKLNRSQHRKDDAARVQRQLEDL